MVVLQLICYIFPEHHCTKTPLEDFFCLFEILQLLGTWYYQSLVISHFSSVVAYHFGSVTLFIKAWIQVLPKFKSCSRHVGDLRWWRSLTNVSAGNKTKCLSSVNHSAKQFVIIVIIIIIIIDQMVLVLHSGTIQLLVERGLKSAIISPYLASLTNHNKTNTAVLHEIVRFFFHFFNKKARLAHSI